MEQTGHRDCWRIDEKSDDRDRKSAVQSKLPDVKTSGSFFFARGLSSKLENCENLPQVIPGKDSKNWASVAPSPKFSINALPARAFRENGLAAIRVLRSFTDRHEALKRDQSESKVITGIA